MKRSSVIAPLLLILIGAAFLLHNVWPNVPVAEMLGRYWPFLLILWGGLRLIEIVFWASTDKPLPRSGISGGEWVIIIFLCLGGTAFYTARHSPWFPNGRSLRGMVVNMGESYDYPIVAMSKTTAKPPRVILENFRGNARIIGGPDDKVTASGRKTIRAFQQIEADKANVDTPLELVVQGDQLIIRTNQERVNDHRRVSSDLEITVPKGASIEAHGRMGDFDIRDITGSVEIVSENAGVRLDSIGGAVRVDVRRSDVVRATGVKGTFDLKGRGQDVDLQNIDGQVAIHGEFLGQIQLKNLAMPVRFEGAQTNLEFEKLPGQLHMGPGEFTASNIVGPIRMSSKSRDVQISEFTQSLDLTLERGDIEIRPGKGPLPKMDVRTKSGEIDVALPTAAKFDLRMSTNRGEAHNEYGSPLKVAEENHGGTILGSSGDGPRLVFETGRGSVTARKAIHEDLKVEQQ